MKIRILIYFMVLTTVFSLVACSTENYKNEWVEKNGKKYYYDDTGKKITNCYYEINGERYSFNNSGVMKKSCWVNADGKKIYHDGDGKAVKNGWKKIDGNYYYFKDYNPQSGWVQDSDGWYYLDNNGCMLKNQWVDGQKYYVDGDGKMAVNCDIDISGITYRFDASGKGKEKPPIDILFSNVPYYKEIMGSLFAMGLSISSMESDGGLISYTGSYSSPWYKGGLKNCSARVEYTITDTQGYVVYDGRFYTPKGNSGQKFKASFYVPGLSKGSYMLKITNAE